MLGAAVVATGPRPGTSSSTLDGGHLGPGIAGAFAPPMAAASKLASPTSTNRAASSRAASSRSCFGDSACNPQNATDVATKAVNLSTAYRGRRSGLLGHGGSPPANPVTIPAGVLMITPSPAPRPRSPSWNRDLVYALPSDDYQGRALASGARHPPGGGGPTLNNDYGRGWPDRASSRVRANGGTIASYSGHGGRLYRSSAGHARPPVAPTPNGHLRLRWHRPERHRQSLEQLLPDFRRRRRHEVEGAVRRWLLRVRGGRGLGLARQPGLGPRGETSTPCSPPPPTTPPSSPRWQSARGRGRLKTSWPVAARGGQCASEADLAGEWVRPEADRRRLGHRLQGAGSVQVRCHASDVPAGPRSAARAESIADAGNHPDARQVAMHAIRGCRRSTEWTDAGQRQPNNGCRGTKRHRQYKTGRHSPGSLVASSTFNRGLACGHRGGGSTCTVVLRTNMKRFPRVAVRAAVRNRHHRLRLHQREGTRRSASAGCAGTSARHTWSKREDGSLTWEFSRQPEDPEVLLITIGPTRSAPSTRC